MEVFSKTLIEVMYVADVDFSLPGAIASYGLALGVAQIDGKLPSPVLALLTGLNAATVGIVAHAAVYLSYKTITDKLTRMLVVLSACAGLLYNALWYFPMLMVAGGVATLLWDSGLKRQILERLAKNKGSKNVDVEAQTMPIRSENTSVGNSQESDRVERRQNLNQQTLSHSNAVSRASENAPHNRFTEKAESARSAVPENMEIGAISWKRGLIIVVAFFTTFTIIMVLRSLLRSPPRSLDLLANLVLAGKHQQST